MSKTTADKICKVVKGKGLFEPLNANKPLADTSIVKYHRFISSVLTAAVQWQVIPSNPCERVKPPHVEYKEAPVLDEIQTAELIECLDAEPLKYKTAVMLVLYTGIRRGELCGLNWSDIDFEHGLVHIQRELLYTASKGLFEDTTKTKQSKRVIQIPDVMLDLLNEYKISQLRNKLLLGTQWIDTDKVFTGTSGGCLRPDCITIWFHDFIKRNNLPPVHLHSLRHTSATLLIAGGVDVATVSHRLGHANKTTTLNIYTHAIQSADAIAAERLQNILNPSLNYKAN